MRTTEQNPIETRWTRSKSLPLQHHQSLPKLILKISSWEAISNRRSPSPASCSSAVMMMIKGSSSNGARACSWFLYAGTVGWAAIRGQEGQMWVSRLGRGLKGRPVVAGNLSVQLHACLYIASYDMNYLSNRVIFVCWRVHSYMLFSSRFREVCLCAGAYIRAYLSTLHQFRLECLFGILY